MAKLSQAAMQPRGGGGGSAAQMALAQFVSDQQASVEKMQSNFMKMQQAQAEDSAQRDEEMSSGVTDALNQIVKRQDEKELKEERLTEKRGDREYQKEFIQWQKQLGEESNQYQMEMLERMNQQTTAVNNFVKGWDTKRQEFSGFIDATEMRAEDMRARGLWDAAPGGLERYETLIKRTRAARAWGEDVFRSSHMHEAMQILNQSKIDILKGADYQDLTGLEVDPFLEDQMEAAGMPAMDMDLSDEDLQEIEMAGGYIPGGLIGRDPDDPEMKRFGNFNMLGFEAMNDMVFDEQMLAIMQSSRDRDKFKILRMKQVQETGDMLQPLLEHEASSYKELNARGLDGVMAGIENVVLQVEANAVGFWQGEGLIIKDDSSPRSADMLADQILNRTLSSVLGPNSEPLMQMIQDMNTPGENRKVMDTPAEWFTSVHLLNALTITSNHLNAMGQAPTEGGVTIFAQMAKNLVSSGSRGPNASLVLELAQRTEATRLMGTYDAATEARVAAGLNRVMGVVKSKIVALKSALRNQPIIQGVRAKTRWMGQYGDALAFSYMSDKEPDLITTRGLTPEMMQSFVSDLEGEALPEEGIEQYEQEIVQDMTPMQATFQLLSTFSNRRDLVPTLASGGYADHMPTGEPMMQNFKATQEFFSVQRNDIKNILKKRHSQAAPEGGDGPTPAPDPSAQPTPQARPPENKTYMRGD